MATRLARVNTTLPVSMLKLIDGIAARKLEDRSTAVRQLIAKGVIEEKREEILKAFALKKLTIREAAEALGVSYRDVEKLIEQAGIPITDLSEEEIKHRAKEIMR